VQSQLDALQHQISQTNQINNLSNVTITSPSFSGVSTSNIPEGSNLYYTDARVESLLASSSTAPKTFTGNTWTALNLFSAGASSTQLSVFNKAYFGSSATTTIDSAGNVAVAGNVGVGTTTPWGKLAVSTAAQQDGLIPLFNIASTTNASLLTLLGNGSVGIGTSSPSSLAALTVAGVPGGNSVGTRTSAETINTGANLYDVGLSLNSYDAPAGTPYYPYGPNSALEADPKLS
jgi:hypothetical protein